MTEEEYESALDRIDELMKLNPKHDTEECAELIKLADMVDAYEDIHYPIDKPL